MKLLEKKLNNLIQKEPVKARTPGHSLDTLFARLRRLEARVDHLEASLSTLRRDHNRVERNYYSTAKSAPQNGDKMPAGIGPDGLENWWSNGSNHAEG